jgi:hypothetical protein
VPASATLFEQPEGAARVPLARNFCRREPEKNLLHQLVCAHLDTLLAERRADDPDGYGLPAFVEQEFRRFIDCGVASRGFVRLVCDRCRGEMIVGFSCKGMGFCDSWRGRRVLSFSAVAFRSTTRASRIGRSSHRRGSWVYLTSGESKLRNAHRLVHLNGGGPS